jgi:hypothetical protein
MLGYNEFDTFTSILNISDIKNTYNPLNNTSLGEYPMNISQLGICTNTKSKEVASIAFVNDMNSPNLRRKKPLNSTSSHVPATQIAKNTPCKSVNVLSSFRTSKVNCQTIPTAIATRLQITALLAFPLNLRYSKGFFLSTKTMYKTGKMIQTTVFQRKDETVASARDSIPRSTYLYMKTRITHITKSRSTNNTGFFQPSVSVLDKNLLSG